MSERVELWLRSTSAWTVGRKGTFVDDLAALSAGGAIEDYEVSMWNDHVPSEGTHDLSPREATVRERVETVETWADEQGYELPAFSRSTKVRGFDGPEYEAVVLPLAVLLAFEDGELQWMAPYSDGDEHVSVPDRIEELTGRLGETESVGSGERVEAE